MSHQSASERKLKEKLKKTGKFTDEQIEKLIEDYLEAGQQEFPDTDVLARLAQKRQEDRYLRVNFKLSKKQYAALAAYFNDYDQSGNVLVGKAIEEFISMIG